MIGPVQFQFEALGRRIWKKQREICKAVSENRSVSIKGCHGSGKSFVISGYVVYELLTNPESLVVVIAPTLRQVKILWGEIELAIQAVPCKLPERTTTSWKLSSDRYAIGFSSSRGVNAQGFHGKRVLIIADEAPGVSADLWDAIEGIRMAGDVRIVKLGNPTVPSGVFYDDFNRNRGLKGHANITISAFDTPNLVGCTMDSLLRMSEEELDYAPFPMLARRRAVVELYHKWGPSNPRFISRVLGEFPNQGDDAVFQLDWIEAAGLPYDDDELAPHLRPGLYIQVGLDVAGAGDDETVATARIGPFVVDMVAWQEADPLLKAHSWLSALRRRFPGAEIIIVADTVGIGYHFARGLAHFGYDVRGFVAQASPVDPVQYRDAKAEGYFQLREYMKHGHVRGVTDEDTRAQLSGSCRYREVGGRIEIYSKREMRALGLASPDRAESLIMAFARLVPRQQEVVLSNPADYRISPL